MSKVVAATPGLVGGIIGLLLVLNPNTWTLAAVAGDVVLSVSALIVARWRFARSPVVYGWLMEVWTLFYPAAAGLLIGLFLFATIKLGPAWLIRIPGWKDEQKADFVKYGATLAASFVAAFASGDPKKAQNWLWTSTQFRLAAARLGPQDSRLSEAKYYAALMEHTRDNKVSGWGFSARRYRALILAGP